MSLLPDITTPDDIRALKIRLDAAIRSIDASVGRCASLDPTVRESWRSFAEAWAVYLAQDESWLHAPSQMEAGRSFERQVIDWQRLLTPLCTLHAPQNRPPAAAAPLVSDATQSTIRMVAVAGALIAVVAGVRTVLR